MAQDAKTNDKTVTTVKPIPRGWKQVDTFTTIQNCRLDFKQALVEIVLGFKECTIYFEPVKTKVRQISALKLLLQKIGTSERWKQDFLANETKRRYMEASMYVPLNGSPYGGINRQLTVEQVWERKIQILRSAFQEMASQYNLANEENRKLGYQVQSPVLNTSFCELFKGADLAKYILLFEPNFPEDMPDIPSPCKRPLSIDMLDSSNNKYQTEMIGLTFDWTAELPNLDNYLFPGDPLYSEMSWKDMVKIKDWQGEEDKKQAISLVSH